MKNDTLSRHTPPETVEALEAWQRRLGAVTPWTEPKERTDTADATKSSADKAQPALLGVMAFALPGEGATPDKGAPTTSTPIAFNAHISFPAASTIKVYILQALLERVAAGTSSLNEELILQAEDQVSGSGVLKSLSAGRAYSLLDLATLMIIVSDNTATNLLIDLLGVDKINDSMHRNGWLNSRLSGKLQLSSQPVVSREPSSTTPADLADYFARLWLGELLPADLTEVAKDIYRRQQFGELGRYLDYDSYSVEVGEAPWRIASKSGSIRGVRNDAGVIEAVTPRQGAAVAPMSSSPSRVAPRAPLVVAIMTSGCPDERFHQDNLGAKVLGAVASELWRALR